MAAPGTENEAIARGCRRIEMLTQEHIERYGAQIVPDCSFKSEGDKCGEYKCVGGQQLVIYCDGSNGCTRYYECPC